MEFVAYPEFFVYPYLTTAGWLPYRQIIDQHFPGLFFMPVNFFTLGFINPRSLKILSLLLVIFQSALIYRIAKSISSRVYPLIAMVTFALWQPFFSGNHLWLKAVILPPGPIFLLCMEKCYSLLVRCGFGCGNPLQAVSRLTYLHLNPHNIFPPGI